MAVTVIKRPLATVPAYNDIEFHATSDQFAVSDFKFYITIEIVSYSTTFTITPTGASGVIRFNVWEQIKKYVSNYYPFGVYGWQYVTDGIQDITVNIGEFYSGTVHTGTDYDFEVFNASLTRAERATYLPANYEVGAGRNNVWLNNLYEGSSTSGRTTCKSDQDMVFYFLQTGAMRMSEVVITTYDSAGATIATSTIAAPSPSVYPATGQIRYMCINVGPLGLTNIASGSVTGTYPIITASVASYQIAFYGRTSMGGPINYFYRYVDIDDCAPKYDNVTLHYLNRFGAYDFVNIYGNHQKTLQGQKTFYKGLNTYFDGSYEEVGVGNQTVSTPLSINQKVLNSSYENRQVFRSDWLTDFQIEALQDLITSPATHSQSGSTYKRYQVTDNRYQFKNINEKLQRLDVNLSEGVTERRQYE